eukprot:51614_1
MPKVAVITGASAGIGKGTTIRLLQDGWNVILIARSTDKMKEIVKDYNYRKYKIISCDLSKPELLLTKIMPSIKSYLNENNLSGIDLLLNNAGGSHGGGSSEYLSKDKLLTSWKWHIDLMLTAPYLLTQYISMDDLFNLNGSVINIGSLSAYYGTRMPFAYPIAKSGVHGLTKCLAFELSRKNKKKVRCNNLELGFVRTDIIKQSNPNITQKIEDLYYKSTARVTPLQRNGTIKDVIEWILFLIDTEKSGWFTGQNIIVDGGVSLPMFHQKPKL